MRKLSHRISLSGRIFTSGRAGKARGEGAMRPCSSAPRKILPTMVCVLLTSAALTALTGGAMADETWVGGISDDWNNSANWQVNVPTSSDVVTITDPTSFNTLIGGGNNAQAGSLQVGYSPTYVAPGGWSPSGLAGQLNIAGGGTFATDTASVGYQSGYFGFVVVTDSGSTWTNSGQIRLGELADGSVLVTNGGAVTTGIASLGYNSGTLGTLTLDSGASWTVTGTGMSVGVSGNGTLVMNTGATLDTSFIGLAEYTGSIGYALIDGAGTVLTSTTSAYIGSFGVGVMDLLNGGAAFLNTMNVGQDLGGEGEVNVDGVGSNLNVAANAYVGMNGTGAVSLTNGGTWNIGDISSPQMLYIGMADTGTGNVTLSDSSLLNLWGSAVVGNSGNGSFVLNSGSTLVATGGATIGLGAGANGSVSVDGAFSNLGFGGDIIIGGAGAGVLSVTNGGYASSGTGDVYLASIAGGSGTVSVDGANSRLNVAAGDLNIGWAGTGAASVTNGGRIDAVGVNLGVGAGGTMTVTGTGSLVAASSDLTVGSQGSGSLLVANDAMVTADNATIGGSTGSTGLVQVYSAGTILAATNDLAVGKAGTGTLLIGAGGAVNSNIGYIGQSAGGDGTVAVDGAGSSWTMTNDLVVGFAGTSSMTITNGGQVINGGVVNTVGAGVDGVGEVLISGSGSAWQNTNGGLLIGGSGEGEVTVANGGALTFAASSGIGIAINAGSTGTLNIGAAEGNAATGAGTVTAMNVIFGDGAGQLVFNHTDAAYTFTPLLESLDTEAQIRHLAGHTILTGDGSLFTGTTNVLGGTLSVNNFLDGTVNVTGGTLGGSGIVGLVTVNAGGALAPGNSIGTLTVGGLTFNAGSTYTVELNDGGFVAGVNNDLIQTAFGTVTINGGTVHVTPENGTDDGTTYTPGTYTIIQAGNGVNGTFDAVSDDYAFLNFALSYDPNYVYLTSSAVGSFCLSGMTANECAAGDGVFSLASGSLFGAVLNLSNAEAPGALAQLSGEVVASTKTALIEDSRFVREAAVSRTRAVFDGVASDRTASERRVSDRLAFWGQGFGSWGQWDGDGNAAQLDRSIGGLFLGGDTRVDSNVRVGALTGYSRSNIAVDDLHSSATVDSYYLGLYGGRQWGALGLRAGGAYTWNAVDMTRTIAFTGFSDQLATSFDAATAQVFGEAGYRIDAGQARFEPFANLAYVNLDTDSFTEGGGAAALSVASDNTDTTFLTLGLRADTTAMLGGSAVRFAGALGWRHAFGDTLPTSLMAFASGGDAFTVAAVPIAEEVLVVDAGVNVTLAPAAMLGLIYGGQFGSGESDQSVKGSLDVKF